MENSLTGSLFLCYVLFLIFFFHFKGNGSYSSSDSLMEVAREVCWPVSHFILLTFYHSMVQVPVPDKATEAKTGKGNSRGWKKHLFIFVKHQSCVSATGSCSLMDARAGLK